MDKSGWVMGEVLARQARARGHRTFLTFQNRPDVSYAEADEIAHRVSRGVAGLGAGPGDRVGVWLPNGPEILHASFGIYRAGAVAGGLRGSRDGRVGEGGAARTEDLVELARERYRTGAHVDHRLARLHEGGEAFAGAETDRPHLGLSRQAQEDDLRAARHLGHRGRGLHAVGGERGERR